MTHAELMRKHATDATNEGGMWFSGEYLSRIAETAESLEDENAKLRKLAHLVAEYTSADQCEGCVTKRACNAGELDMCWIRKAILEKLRDLRGGVGHTCNCSNSERKVIDE